MSKEIISNIKELGTPVTTGELIEILSKYPKNTSFGFRNQPLQTLYEVDSMFVVFQIKIGIGGIDLDWLKEADEKLENEISKNFNKRLLGK